MGWIDYVKFQRATGCLYLCEPLEVLISTLLTTFFSIAGEHLFFPLRRVASERACDRLPIFVRTLEVLISTLLTTIFSIAGEHLFFSLCRVARFSSPSRGSERAGGLCCFFSVPSACFFSVWLA
jgi:hypothetical protein